VFFVSFLSKSVTSPDARLTVLEERLQSFDEISRQMLTKLEQAVDKISESNQSISRILARHEERIDRSAEANNSTIRLIEKTEQELKNRISDTETSIDELKKTRWVWVGIVLASSFFFSQLRIGDRLFHHPPDNTSPGYVYARPVHK
jgi:gas vesicle protein